MNSFLTFLVYFIFFLSSCLVLTVEANDDTVVKNINLPSNKPGRSQRLESISLQLIWKHQFEFAGFYAAIEKGYYKKRGLEVSLKEYQEELDIIDEVLAGRVEYGIANNSIFMARFQNKPVVLLANYFKRMPLVIFGQPGHHSLEALKGKRLMISSKELNSPLIQLAFQTANLKPGINIDIVPHSFNVGPFIRGEVEAMTAFRSNEPYFLESKGVPYQTIDMASYIPVLGDDYLFTSEHEIGNHPQRASDFLQASHEGWQYALQHPEEIIDLILQHYSQHKSREALRYEAKKIRQLMLPETFPIGGVIKSRIRAVTETLLMGGFIQDTTPLTGFIFTPLTQGVVQLGKKNGGEQQTASVRLSTEELAWLRQHPTVQVANETDWPPFDFVDNGMPAGYSIDLLALVAEKIGLNLAYVHGPTWDDLLQQGRERQLDLFPAIWKTAEREQFLDFTESYIATPHILIVRKEENDVRTIDDLQGRRVAGVKGYADTEQLRTHFPEIKVLEVTNVSAGLRAVAYGQADAYLGTQGAIAYAIRDSMVHGLKIAGETTLKGRLQAGNMHFAARNDWPHLAILLAKGLAAVTVEERLALQDKWINLPKSETTSTFSLTPEETQWLQEHPVISTSVHPAWAPIEFIDHDGRYQGISSDYLQKIGKMLGVQFKRIPAATAAAMQTLIATKQVDMIPAISRTTAPVELTYCTEPYLRTPVGIFSADNVTYLTGLKALLDKKIAVLADDTVQRWLQQDFPQLQLIPASSLEKGLQLVAQGQVYAFVGALVPTSYYIGKMGLTHIKVVGETPYTYEIGMAVRKDWPLFSRIMQKALQTISQDEQDTIYHKWISIRYQHAVDWSLVWQILIIAALLVSSIVYWNRRLAKEVNARKKNEEMLRKLSTAVEKGPASIVITDSQGIIEYVNPEFERVTGYQRDEVIGQNPRILKSEQMSKAIYHELWQTIISGKIWRGELENRKKNGQLYWEFAAICPVKNDAGQITHFIGVKENISLLKIREQELRTAKEVADSANQAKSEFLANMSHEIRTPMNAVIGMGNLLKGTPLDREQRAHLAGLRVAADKLLAIINDILDFSKIEAGKFVLEHSEFHLDDLLRNLFEMMTPLAQEKALKLQLSMTATSDYLLIGDPVRLGQVLTNLIANAIKFTDQGEVTVTTQIMAQSSQQLTLRFMIRDTGIGIAPEEQASLFQPFVQADGSLNRQHGGTGLGLTISRQLVEMMGGKIWIESAPNQGSTFLFEIVCELVSKIERAALPLAKTVAISPLPQVIGIEVLLAEDDELNQIVAQKLLESYGARVTLVHNGEEAVQAVECQPFDLVLMDIQMPILNGYQATKKIRQDSRFKTLPIIAMTAHAMAGEREKCLAAGMTDHFAKPFQPEDLKKLLVQWAGSSSKEAATHQEIQENLERFVEKIGKNGAVLALNAVLTLVPERLKKMRQAEEMKDWQTVHQQAHNLKGSLNIYGSKRLTHLLAMLANNRPLTSDEARPLMEALEVEFAFVLRLVQKMRDR